MTKKIIFRADGNSNTGLGHLYRVFALIEMLKESFDYVLATRDTTDLIIIPETYNLQIIPSRISIHDEPNWLINKFPSKEHIIIADGYEFEEVYQKDIKNKGFKLVYIDDLAATHMHADVVINHSIYITPKDYSAEAYTKFALGPEYALLRPKFIEASKQHKRIDEISNIFVSFGGADFYDLTNKCLQGIIDLENIQKINVVIGSSYKHTQIYNTIKGFEDKVVLHKKLSESQMIDLMDQCQLAIVPSSTISYEVCSVKMVILGGYYIENQINIYNGLKTNELIFCGGDFNAYTSHTFYNNVLDILNDNPINYQDKIVRQSRLFDGKQNKRILSLILEENE